MRRTGTFMTVLLAAAVLGLAACAPKNSIDANAISGPLKAVTSRHDAYVKADATLTDVEKSTYLRSSEILNEITDTALAPPG